jgi:hypothetical protein
MKLLLAIKKRLQNQTGAVALMTLGYMIACGMICLVTLWGIANATGAYNTLYGVTQSAAYAAASQTDPTSIGETGTVRFLCDGSAVECRSGATFNAAQNAAITGLSAGVPGRFGLTYGVAQFTDLNGNYTGSPLIYAYSPVVSPGEAETYFNDTGSCTRYNAETQQESLICWDLNDAVSSSVNFEPGVAVYMRAEIPLCMSSLCPNIGLSTAAAATTSQPNQ